MQRNIIIILSRYVLFSQNERESMGNQCQSTISIQQHFSTELYVKWRESDQKSGDTHAPLCRSKKNSFASGFQYFCRRDRLPRRVLGYLKFLSFFFWNGSPTLIKRYSFFNVIRECETYCIFFTNFKLQKKFVQLNEPFANYAHHRIIPFEKDFLSHW